MARDLATDGGLPDFAQERLGTNFCVRIVRTVRELAERQRCYRLSYTSQSEEGWDRSLRRAGKIRKRLGGEDGTATAFPARPKVMWQRAYERLREQAVDQGIGACPVRPPRV